MLGILLGADGDLDDPVQPVLKDPVGFLDVLQLVAVGDQTGGVRLSFFNERKDLPAVTPSTEESGQQKSRRTGGT